MNLFLKKINCSVQLLSNEKKSHFMCTGTDYTNKRIYFKLIFTALYRHNVLECNIQQEYTTKLTTYIFAQYIYIHP